jgi:hypothetical protein
MRKRYYKPMTLGPVEFMKLTEAGHYSFPAHEPSFKAVLVQPRTIMYSAPKVMVVEHYDRDFIVCVLNWEEKGERRISFTQAMWFGVENAEYENLHDTADMIIHQYYNKDRLLQRVEIEIWHDVEVG